MKRALTPLALATLAFAAACSDAAQAPLAAPGAGPLLSAASGKGIPGEYIVVLNDGADARSVAAVAGVSPKHVYTTALDGFSATLNQGQLVALQHNPNVKWIEQDQVVELSTTQTGATWGLDRIDQRNLPLSTTYDYTPTGAGVRAYIIDTGINTGHTDFGGRASIASDFIGGGSDDCHGHGTHVAGTVGSTTYGVAKDVTLLGVRVVDCTGTPNNSTVIAGIDWTAANAVKPAVATVSLVSAASSTVDAAINGLINSGVITVVSAGNSNANACNYSPARVANAITVAASTSSDGRWINSNYGTCVDVFAPGVNIMSTWIGSPSMTGSISGTSMAAPHVAGVAALYLEGNTTASQATVASAIINSATPNKVVSPGTGSPNRLLYSLVTAPGAASITYTGSLPVTNSASNQPSSSGYTSTVSGTHTGNLTAGTGTDFDLYLQKWNGSTWANVATSLNTTSTESINYNGTAGTYRWRVYSYMGSGSFTLVTWRP
ncbi:MAG TPA: S8 family peptidase [Longimicrobium sp.]|nr:S8 family peptidase [Longimicrobium sp.]